MKGPRFPDTSPAELPGVSQRGADPRSHRFRFFLCLGPSFFFSSPLSLPPVSPPLFPLSWLTCPVISYWFPVTNDTYLEVAQFLVRDLGWAGSLSLVLCSSPEPGGCPAQSRCPTDALCQRGETQTLGLWAGVGWGPLSGNLPPPWTAPLPAPAPSPSPCGLSQGPMISPSSSGFCSSFEAPIGQEVLGELSHGCLNLQE